MLSRMSLDRAGQELGGTYRLTRILGEGGMGQVWEAQHVRLPKRFAVKFLHAEALRNADVFARFRREAEIASAIGNAHIVDVVDFNHDAEGVPYMVLEFLDGEDLAARLVRRGPLSVDEAVAIAEQVAGALEAAHAKGIVHRDLKPQNIFLVRFEDRDDFVKVLDFGISKVLDSASSMTKTGAIFGTPNFMSPEQVDGQISQIDGRTDIFALGAILYEMLTGKGAFDAPTISAVFNQVCHKEPEPIATLRPEVPERVRSVIARALQKQRDLRFASMADLRGELLGPAARPRTGASHPPAGGAHAAPSTTLQQSTGQLPTLAAPGKRRSWVLPAVGAGVAMVALGLVLALRGAPPDAVPTAAVVPEAPASAVAPAPPTPVPVPPTPEPAPPVAVPAEPAAAPTPTTEPAPSQRPRRRDKPEPVVTPTGPALPDPPKEPPAKIPDAGVPAQPANDLRAKLAETEAAFRRKDYAEAIRRGREILAVQPKNVRVLRLVGLAACASKDTETARWVHDQLSEQARTQFVTSCARQGVTIP